MSFQILTFYILGDQYVVVVRQMEVPVMSRGGTYIYEGEYQ